MVPGFCFQAPGKLRLTVSGYQINVIIGDYQFTRVRPLTSCVHSFACAVEAISAPLRSTLNGNRTHFLVERAGIEPASSTSPVWPDYNRDSIIDALVDSVKVIWM